jgi:ubiquinone/menaquinone biosynthesis C-methylase UbiE
MSYDAKEFFDNNVTFYHYGNARIHNYDYFFIVFINNTKKNTTLSLLDIGGGGGTFAKLVSNDCPNIEVTVLDTSQEMLNQINESNIKKIKGMLPDQMFLNSSYDYIHVKEVFHHITGSSINNSKKLLKESLQNIKNVLNDDGFLLIHELFYESPVIPTSTSNTIFYLLKIQNKCGIRIFPNEFLLNLNVYFYTRSEFIKILNECGYVIIDSYEENWSNTLKKKLLFLKDWGRMVFICKKAEGSNISFGNI